jgi:hypothetical protein
MNLKPLNDYGTNKFNKIGRSREPLKRGDNKKYIISRLKRDKIKTTFLKSEKSFLAYKRLYKV